MRYSSHEYTVATDRHAVPLYLTTTKLPKVYLIDIEVRSLLYL